MTEDRKSVLDNQALAASLSERRELIGQYLSDERELMERSASERAERAGWWEDMVTELRTGAWSRQLTSYKSMAGSMAGLLGSSIKEQAKIMVPFEAAEATKEFARFLGTKDPSALASSLKHLLAAKQYAAAAKAGSPSSSSGGGGGGGGGNAKHKPEPEAQTPERKARVIVNVGRQVGIVDTYEFARNIIEAINENVADDVVLEVAP